MNSNFITLLKPRYWLLWAGIGLLWSLTRLPHRWQRFTGKKLGLLFYKLANRRRKIASINLKLCFPELNEKQQHKLVRQHFESLGMGLLEMLSAWWLPDKRLKSLGTVSGLEHLDAALKRGKGVILLSAHFTSLEIGTRFLTMHTAIHATYRPHENPVIEHFMQKSRESRAEKAIPREAVRDMIRSLKQNKALWFASDQNFGHKNSLFADFFGIPAATNTAISRITKITGAAVIPFFTQRIENGYKVILLPAINMQGALQDATKINQLIETQTRNAPEQYLWVHRRFKDRPQGEANIYDSI
ncbi:LpxL/LpxP family Kdo(2)-lipid IV(A) lauroyl/palmitoleoyl acyltransferase [Candidatus Marithrix sp. Canyon 246]|uniref:LpxL/LpxP family Kdo(2)-lipid IV(A) lauroyl/palmitoleoyl acyltransferase n=1 Tax=Candidatus Marithrix sp. Canyon 246 TaxID=1827136 RepID=UPI00084A25B5|nr:LpxL/LpxP family Kdo(2)-lipid IV(A) lauroyl/palmitoleoyl acyltransferase [Candidatus Marithrix sp. Canyon 246]